MLNPGLKKILIALSGVLIIALGGVIIYNIFFLSENTDDGASVGGNQEEENGSQAQLVSEVKALGPTSLGDNRLKFYEQKSGNVVAINGDGSSREVLDDMSIDGLSDVRWGPSDTWVATKADGQYSTSNYKTGQSHTFKSNISNLYFVGSKVVYTYQTEEGVDLSIADPIGQNFEKLVDLSMDEISLTPLPQTFKISYVLKPTAYRASSLTIVSSTTKKTKTLLTDKFGLQVSWGPKGKKGLISSTAQRGGSEMQFSVIDTGGNVQQTFGTGTVIDKVVWKDPNTLYFTKPNLSSDVVLPDDYMNGELGEFRESLYKLDLSSGEAEKLIPDIGGVNSTDLVLNEAGNRLFFRNKRDGKLYGIDIPE